MSEEINDNIKENNELSVEANSNFLIHPDKAPGTITPHMKGVQERHPSLHPRLQSKIDHIDDSAIPHGIPRAQHELTTLPGKMGSHARDLMGPKANPPHMIERATHILNNNLTHASEVQNSETKIVEASPPSILHPDVPKLMHESHRGTVKNPETDGRLHDNRKKKKLKKSFEVEQYIQRKKEHDYIQLQKQLHQHPVANLFVNPLYGSYIKTAVNEKETISLDELKVLYASLGAKLKEIKEVYAKNELQKVISIVASLILKA